MSLRYLLFCDITQCKLIVVSSSFTTAFHSHLQGPSCRQRMPSNWWFCYYTRDDVGSDCSLGRWTSLRSIKLLPGHGGREDMHRHWGRQITYLLPYSLTPCSRILLEKPTVSQSRNSPHFMEPQRFITAFTSARHLYLSWAISIQSMLSHPYSSRSTFILSSHLCLGLLSGLFPSGFPTKTLCTQLLSPIHATCPAYLILLFLITWTIMGEGHRSLSPSLCSFLHSHVALCLSPKYSHQHPILKHPQPMFLPQCQWPISTPIQHNSQKYNSVYLNL